MAPDSLAPEVVCWSSPDRARMAQRMVQAMGDHIHPIAFGGPQHPDTDAAAKALGVPSFDDLRQTLIDRAPSQLLIAGSQTVADDIFALAREEGIAIFTLDPIAASLTELTGRFGKANHAQQPAIGLLPAFDRSIGMLGLGQVDDHLGNRRLVQAVNLGPTEHQNLFTRLYDLWSITLRFIDVPETVSASQSATANQESGVPDNIRLLTGHMAVHARGLSGAAALLHAGVAPMPTEQQHLRVFGDRGRLTLTHHAFDLSNDFDDFHDQAIFETTPPTDFAQAMAMQWQQAIRRPNPDLPNRQADPIEHEKRVLACCLACLLSARTGQAESPFTVEQMGGR